MIYVVTGSILIYLGFKTCDSLYVDPIYDDIASRRCLTKMKDMKGSNYN